MVKIIDRIVLFAILFVIFTLWSTYIIGNIYLGVCLSLIFVLIFGLLTKSNKKEKFHSSSYIPKLTTLSFNEQNDLFIKIISPELHPRKSNYGLIKIGEDGLFLPCLRFQQLSADEIYRKVVFANRNGYKKLYLLTNDYDTVAFEKIKQFLPISVLVIKTDEAVNALKQENALPSLPINKKNKPKLKAILNSSFKRKNAKYFLLSGISLGFFAFFTPMKLYYLIFCTLSLSAGALCLFKKNDPVSKFFK